MTNRRKHPVRLANVDTPERREPGYQDAKKALQGLIQGKEVTIDTKAGDRYTGSVVNVKLGTKSVNKTMKAFEKRRPY